MSSTITASVVTGGQNNHSTVASEANAYATDFVSQGVLGSTTNTNGAAPTTGSFGVNQNTGSDLNLKILGTGNTGSGASVAYVLTTPASQDKQVLRARMTADYTGYAINSNSTGSTVYDWIYLQASATNANVPSAGADNVVTLLTSRSTSNTTDNGTPPTYGILLAVVTVANGATAITNANISDQRTQASISASATGNSTGWTALGYPLTYSSNGGDKNYVVTASTDLTGILSEGMKMRITRAVTPPTQSMAFASGSSQYASKTSPTGVTFTAAFTCEAWVYLNSYTGSAQNLICRRSGTAGAWFLRIESAGQAGVGYGDSSGNFTTLASYQSIPLRQWTHIAGVVSSVSSKTGAIYINGTSATTQLTASAATTLVQAGNLALGTQGSTATEFFDGYVSEARVWSASQTQANVQANMNISLTGSESNLVALFQGNGNFTDKTANANTLTASGGAIATQANNPYNALEYAVITSISYSNPTCTINLFTGDAGNLPNMTLSSPQYSVQESPYGLPGGLGKNRVVGYRLVMASQSTAATSAAQINGLSCPVIVPAGRRIKALVQAVSMSGSVQDGWNLDVWDGTVGSGARLVSTPGFMTTSGTSNFACVSTPPLAATSGSHTYNAAYYTNAGTLTLGGSTTAPSYLSVELV